MKYSLLLSALAVAVSLVACGKHEHADHDHESAPTESGGHAHEPRFGGALVELGDHAANLEVLLDPATGELTMFLLDAHATKLVKSAQTTLALTVEPEEGEPFALTLNHVASALSTETVGDSSTYRVTDERLKGVDHLHGDIASVSVMGSTFADVEISWPAHEHEH